MSSDSPPPTVVQLRGIMHDMHVDHYDDPETNGKHEARLCAICGETWPCSGWDATAMALQLIDNLIETYPQLTTGANGKRYVP